MRTYPLLGLALAGLSGALASIGHRSVAMPAHVSLMPRGLVNTSGLIQLQMVVKMKDEDIESQVRRLADPSSALYGKWMTNAEVKDAFGPDEGSVSAVAGWLESQGIQTYDINDWNVNFATDVATANRLLNADFAWFNVRNVPKLRTLQYSIPNVLLDHVDLVTPTTYFGDTQPHHPAAGRDNRMPVIRQIGQQLDNCSAIITPQCLDQIHNFRWYEPERDVDSPPPSRIGFASFLNQSAIIEYRKQFVETFNITGTEPYKQVEVNGGVSDQTGRSDSGEADLDVQLLTAVGRSLPVTEFIVGGSPPFVPNVEMPTELNNTNEPYLDFYQYLMTQDNDDIPQVISLSYGEPEETVPFDYAKRVCELVGLVGLRGISILHSSGDTGIGSSCISNDGKNTTQFGPIFPATCPYVTSIGGTQGFSPEIAWTGSSGGFSRYFERPWYQQDAVEDYLENGISSETMAYYAEYANFDGRGFPDAASHSFSPGIAILQRGRIVISGGTSASAPIVAALIGLLNNMRLSNGLPTLGFLNPWLYQLNGRGLVDVARGGAIGCGGVNLQTGRRIPGGGIIPWASWNGTSGWDPATGLGLPDLRELASVVVERRGE